MRNYTSDGTKLLNVEFDDQPSLHDVVDGMRVLSTDRRGEDYVLFLLDTNGTVGCYVLDETYIVGRVFGFESLPAAVEAWNEGEV
jgi:hypothetical protein